MDSIKIVSDKFINTVPHSEIINIRNSELIKDEARERLIRYLQDLFPDFDQEQLSMLEMQYKKWNDSSLGVALPGEVYLPVITSGYEISFQYKDQIFTIHADAKGCRFVMPSGIELK